MPDTFFFAQHYKGMQDPFPNFKTGSADPDPRIRIRSKCDWIHNTAYTPAWGNLEQESRYIAVQGPFPRVGEPTVDQMVINRQRRLDQQYSRWQPLHDKVQDQGTEYGMEPVRLQDYFKGQGYPLYNLHFWGRLKMNISEKLIMCARNSNYKAFCSKMPRSLW